MLHTQHTQLCASHAVRLIANQGERGVAMNPCGLGGNRTRDSRIINPLFFRLNYTPLFGAAIHFRADSDMLSSILRFGLNAP